MYLSYKIILNGFKKILNKINASVSIMDTDLTLNLEVESKDLAGSNKIATSSKSKKRKPRSSAATNELPWQVFPRNTN